MTMPGRTKRKASAISKENKVPIDILVAQESPKRKRRRSQGPRGQSQSCHQCRQSIHSSKGASELKLGQLRIKCSQCTRYWCEKCLENRYGIIRGTTDITTWSCPVCSGNCNCSLCRKKSGKLATGVLTPLVKTAGYTNVSEFLQSGTNDIAKCLQWQSTVIEKSGASSQAHVISGEEQLISAAPNELQHEEYCILTAKTNDNGLESTANGTSTHTSNDELKKFVARQRKRKQFQPKKVVSEDTPSLAMATEDSSKRRMRLRELKQEVSKKMKQELLERKREEKARKVEERKKAREKYLQEKEQRQKIREKLTKAKQVLRDNRRKSEMERIEKLMELKRATQREKEEKRRKHQLVTNPLTVTSNIVSSNFDTEGEVLLHPLPEYSLLELGVAEEYVGDLLFVTEYLNTFGEKFDIKEKITTPKSFCSILDNTRSFNDILYLLLSSLIDNDDSTLSNVNKLNKRNVEDFAANFIHRTSDVKVTIPNDVIESRLVVLTFICNATLNCKSVVGSIKDTMASFEQQQKDFRLKVSSFTKESMATLKTMCDGGSSVDDLIAKREEFSKELQKLQTMLPCCSNLIRNDPLGKDRHERLYWSLTTVLGVIVEDVDRNKWMIIDNLELLNEVLVSLNQRNDEEKKLHSCLKKEIESNRIFFNR